MRAGIAVGLNIRDCEISYIYPPKFGRNLFGGKQMPCAISTNGRTGLDRGNKQFEYVQINPRLYHCRASCGAGNVSLQATLRRVLNFYLLRCFRIFEWRRGALGCLVRRRD